MQNFWFGPMSGKQACAWFQELQYTKQAGKPWTALLNKARPKSYTHTKHLVPAKWNFMHSAELQNFPSLASLMLIMPSWKGR